MNGPSCLFKNILDSASYLKNSFKVSLLIHMRARDKNDHEFAKVVQSILKQKCLTTLSILTLISVHFQSHNIWSLILLYKIFGNPKISLLQIDSPPQTSLQHSPPMNLRIADNMRMQHESSKIETPLPLRLGHQLNPTQITAPLRIQVTSPGRLGAPSPHTNLHGAYSHGGIVRIAPPSPNNNGPLLHRPFSPPRLTWYSPMGWKVCE